MDIRRYKSTKLHTHKEVEIKCEEVRRERKGERHSAKCLARMMEVDLTDVLNCYCKSRIQSVEWDLFFPSPFLYFLFSISFFFIFFFFPLPPINGKLISRHFSFFRFSFFVNVKKGAVCSVSVGC